MSVNSNNGNNFQSERTDGGGAIDAQQATTKMVSDEPVVEAKMNMQVKLNSDLLTTASLGVEQDIHFFLKKPYPVTYGVFSSTDTSGTFPVNRLFESLLGVDIYKSKIKGFLGMRATIVLRVTFNAQRFQQGRYLLAFMPMVTTNTATGYGNSAAKSAQLRYSKTTVTQLPHVEFDLNCDTEATLEIPYVSPYTHFSLLDNIGDVGSYFLYPYSPLATGSTGSTNCQYTIWASFKDVQLVAPTLPQMAKSKGSMRPVASIKKRGTVTEMEQDSVGSGPMENVLSNVSKVADHLAQIPMIGLVAKQVSWATAIAARAASVFGWSKPLDLDHACRMYHNYAPFLGNCDTMDMGLPLSWVSTNSVETLPGFAGSDIDETSIDFIKTIPAYSSEFVWNTTQTTENVLYTANLTPSNFKTTYTDAGGNIQIYTPTAWLASMFKLYKGSLKFTFKIVKTEFHSGRLMMSYQPRQGLATAASVPDSTYLLREVMDIRSGNEFSFVIPFASLQTYREMNQPYGLIQLNVLNELVAPASVASSVTVLVEVSCAPDMQFAIPQVKKHCAYVPTTIQSDFDFQMDAGGECVVESGILSDGAMFDDHLSGARFCIGEKLMSLMQLVKTPVLGYGYSAWADGSELQFYPSGTITSTLSAGSATAQDASPDWYDFIAPAFALSRGGFRLKIMDFTADGNTTMVRSNVYPVTQQVVVNQKFRIGSPASYFDFGALNYLTFPAQYADLAAQPVEVQMPQYHKFHSRVNSESMLGLNMGANVNNTVATPTTPNMFVNCQNRSGNFIAANTFVFRSVADDFQLGYFLAVPPYILVQ